MSTETTHTDREENTPDPRDEPGAWIRANEQRLREQANSDANSAWVAERLLYSEGLEP